MEAEKIQAKFEERMFVSEEDREFKIPKEVHFSEEHERKMKEIFKMAREEELKRKQVWGCE